MGLRRFRSPKATQLDVVGAQPGDVFIVSSENDPTWGEDALTVMYFDSLPGAGNGDVPEPAGLALMAATVLALRRRK